MKSFLRVIAFTLMFVCYAAWSQQPPVNGIDPNAPTLTLEEKISLTTDDIKKGDVLEKLQKQYLDAIKPITEHQDATRVAIEKEHSGWILEQGAQGWHFTKKPEPPKPAEPAKAPAAPKK